MFDLQHAVVHVRVMQQCILSHFKLSVKCLQTFINHE